MSNIPHFQDSIPKKLTAGEHKGKYYCTQYCCYNNYGIRDLMYPDSKVNHPEYPKGCCKLKKPKLTDFGNGIWGCGDERYGNEIKQY